MFEYADRDHKYALLTHAARYTGIPGALSCTQARVAHEIGLTIQCIDEPATERPRSRRRPSIAWKAAAIPGSTFGGCTPIASAENISRSSPARTQPQTNRTSPRLVYLRGRCWNLRYEVEYGSLSESMLTTNTYSAPRLAEAHGRVSARSAHARVGDGHISGALHSQGLRLDF